MEAYLFQSALRDFLRPQRVIAWILVAFVIAGLAFGWSTTMGQMPAADRYAIISSLMILRLLGLAAAIFSVGIVGQEVEQKTILYLLTRPIARAKIYFARYLAAVVATFLVILLTAALGAVAIFGAKGLTHPYFLRDVVAIALGSASYVALFGFVNLLINKGMIVNLLFAFGWEFAVPNMQGNLFYASVYSYVNSVANHPIPEDIFKVLQVLAGSNGAGHVGMTAAYITLVAMITVLTVGACRWFATHEYVPREEAA